MSNEIEHRARSRVHEGVLPDDDGGNGFAAVGDRPHKSGCRPILPDVDLPQHEAGAAERTAQEGAVKAAGPPVDDHCVGNVTVHNGGTR
jgi:hypothetical protein